MVPFTVVALPIMSCQCFTLPCNMFSAMSGCGYFASFPGPGSPLESPSIHNQHAPIPYDQLHPTGTGSRLPPTGSHLTQGGSGHLPSLISPPPKLPSMITDGNKSLPHRSPNPLKSFSVPGPPGQSSAPSTPNANHLGTCTPLSNKLNSQTMLS